MLEILDTAGLDDFKMMQDLYIKKSDGIILLFSLISASTFDEVIRLVEKVNSSEYNPPIIIGGTKCDLINLREISLADCIEISQRLNCMYMDVSSKTNRNVHQIFHILIKHISREKHLVEQVIKNKKKRRCEIY